MKHKDALVHIKRLDTYIKQEIKNKKREISDMLSKDNSSPKDISDLESEWETLCKTRLKLGILDDYADRHKGADYA